MLEAAFWMNLSVFAAILGLAALGGLFSERSGVVNIGLEGKMLMAACVTALVGSLSGQPALGLLAGIGAAILMSLGHYVMTQTYRIDHIVAGMAVNLFAAGATNFLMERFFVQGQEYRFFAISAYLVVALTAAVAAWFVFSRTRAGLRLFAVGEHPGKARTTGVDPLRVRLQALVVTGVLCGLSGALIASNSGTYTDGMTAGRGFIALAALILGGWKPIPVALACVAFAAFEALQLQFQGANLMGIQTAAAFWNALPYVITLVALAGFVGRTKAPAGLGRP